MVVISEEMHKHIDKEMEKLKQHPELIEKIAKAIYKHY